LLHYFPFHLFPHFPPYTGDSLHYSRPSRDSRLIYVHKKRRDGVSPDIHSFGFMTVIRKRLFASISRVQTYQIARPKSSNIFVFRADWVRSRCCVRSCVIKIFRVFWRFPRSEKDDF
jgi:hypothetical protein